jgi:hypothetical protein
MKFIDFLGFFMFLGPSIEPEKVSVKSASTANPPPKSEIYWVFIENWLKIDPVTVFYKI